MESQRIGEGRRREVEEKEEEKEEGEKAGEKGESELII